MVREAWTPRAAPARGGVVSLLDATERVARRVATPLGAERLRTLLHRRTTQPCAWLGMLNGRAADVDYVVATGDAQTLVSFPAERPSRSRMRAVFAFADADAAVAFLDSAVAATSAEVWLFQVPVGDVVTIAGVLGAGDVAAAAELARVSVRRVAGERAALVVAASAVDVAPEVAMLGDPSDVWAPPLRMRGWRGLLTPRRLVAVALVVAVVVAAVPVSVVLLGRRGAEPVPSVLLYPPVRSGAAVAVDERAGVTVLFGGRGTEDQTWEWRGQSWNRVRAHTAPPARVGAAMAGDPAHGGVVLFGGRSPSGDALGDTWTYRDGAWMAIRGASPPAQAAPVMAYDSTHGVTVLATATQTWTFDGSAWSAVQPRHHPPLAHAVMSDDPAQSRVVVVAAAGTGGGAVQAWAWDGADWSRVATTGSAPTSTPLAATADATDSDVVLLTSAAPSQQVRTWTLSRSAWTAHGDAAMGNTPQGMAGDAAQGLVLAFTWQGSALRAWTWVTTRWLLLGGVPPTVNPPAMPQFAASAFDPVRQQFVVVGGRDDRERTLGTTLTWDGRRWATHPATTEPSPRTGAVMAWDPAAQAMLLYGGIPSLDAPRQLGDTWRWDGSTWAQLHPATSPPADAYASALVSDSAHGTMLLLTQTPAKPGGIGRVDTWLWDGGTWLLQHPAASPAYPGPDGVADDAAHGGVLAVVSHGMVNPQAETWRWDGHDWTELHPATPSQVMPVAVQMVADPGSATVLLLTSQFIPSSTDTTVRGGTQVWDGGDWRSLGALPGLALSRWAPAPYWDPLLRRVVAVGGLGFGSMDQVWMWTEKSWTQLAGTR